MSDVFGTGLRCQKVEAGRRGMWLRNCLEIRRVSISSESADPLCEEVLQFTDYLSIFAHG